MFRFDPDHPNLFNMLEKYGIDHIGLKVSNMVRTCAYLRSHESNSNPRRKVHYLHSKATARATPITLSASSLIIRAMKQGRGKGEQSNPLAMILQINYLRCRMSGSASASRKLKNAVTKSTFMRL